MKQIIRNLFRYIIVSCFIEDVSNHIGRHENVAGQNYRWGKKMTGQEAFLTGHCPLSILEETAVINIFSAASKIHKYF